MGNSCYKAKCEELELENMCLKLQAFYLKEIIIKKEKDLDKLKKYIIASKEKLEKLQNKLDNLF